MVRYLLILATLLVGCISSYAAETVKISAITKEKLGEVVRVEGETAEFKPSRSEKAPNSFMLKDASGSMRVAIWPDQFDKIVSKELIATGARISMEAEVAEFRQKIELHVPDAAQVKVSALSGYAASTTATATATTVTK